MLLTYWMARVLRLFLNDDPHDISCSSNSGSVCDCGAGY
jgi:hypothetical protein